MRTTLHHQDGPISATVSDHEDFCVLSFQQGENQMHIHLPRHMSGPAHLMVDAFNSNMRPAPIPVGFDDETGTLVAIDDGGKVVGFPTGGALSAEAVVAVVAANMGREGDGDHAIAPSDRLLRS